MSGWSFASRLGQDLRYAIRTIPANRAFSAAAILSLALGIGANTAIFTLIDALLLRSLPVPNPTSLVKLQFAEQDQTGDRFSYPVVRALGERTDIFSGVGGFGGDSFNVSSGDDSQRVSGAWVTGGFYRTLGLQPFAGRFLTDNDDRLGNPPTSVLSYGYWENRFSGDLGAVGRSILIEGKPVTIVGISPKGFTGVNIGEAADITLPLAALPQLFPEHARALEAGRPWMMLLARPRTDISMAQAKARLRVIWPQMTSIDTPFMDAKHAQALLTSSIDLVSGATGFSRLRDQFRRPLLVLIAITGLVLLIACANFVNLLLARGATRRKEIALRFAMGASSWRLLRQLLTESLLLSAAGAALGIGLARVCSRLLITLLSSGRPEPLLLDVRPDVRVLLFTTSVAFITGILFGFVPALRATEAGPGAALKGGSRIGSRSRLLPMLVASQIALSLVLLIGAGLFVRTLENLERFDSGFRSQGVLLVKLDPRRAGYKDARLTALYEELLHRFEHLPGVSSASLSSHTPLGGSTWSDPVSINGQPPTKESMHLNLVAPRYFETMGTPLVLGREFSEGDRTGAAGVAIVNETFVRRFVEGRPLGQRISIPNPRYPSFEVVGVVRDTLSQSLREPAPPSVYLPALQYPEMIGSAAFELRTDASLPLTASLVRDELRARFSAIPAQVQVEPLTEQVLRTLNRERMLAALGTCFGALALILAAVGLYGLLGYMVARSTNEIGIRMALGATHEDVLSWVLWRALRLVGCGIAAGIPVAWAGARLISSMLFGLHANDPVTALIALTVLMATALAAAFLPARRASRIDPMVALRHE